MLVRSFARLINRQLSTSTTWRSQFQERLITYQIAVIIQQRRNWESLLEARNLTPHLTPLTFLRVLRIVRGTPEAAITFYNYSVAKLSVQADLRCKCIVMGCLFESGRVQQVKHVLDSVISAYPVSIIVRTAIGECKGGGFLGPMLGLLMESYADCCRCSESLEVFKVMRNHGIEVSIRTCNVVLDCLLRMNEVKMGWCFYGAIIRTGISPDRSMWSLLARMSDKDGKIDRIVVLLDLGICTSAMYSIVIDWCCKLGDFAGAFGQLDEMGRRGFAAGFRIYSSILDGACRVGDVDIIDRTVGMMVKKEFLQRPLIEYDSVICKFCGLGKVYAAEMFFKKASDDGVKLQSDTWGCLLKSFSEEGRVNEALGLHNTISGMGSTVDDACYNSFVNVLCEEEAALLEETSKLLGDLISRGYTPHGSKFSKLLASGCQRKRWREVEDLLGIILEKGLASLLDSSCCVELVRHYCRTRQIHKAVALHDRMETSNTVLDESTYVLLTEALFKQDNVETATRIFHYMKGKGLASSTSFSVVIRGLCRLKDMRKAMRFHDEMLEMGLKPDDRAYKRLIAGFG